MKKIISILLLIISFTGHCDNFGDFASAIWINNCGSSQFYNSTGSGGDCINPTCGTVFNGTNFGSFNQNSAGFSIGGAEIKTWKAANGNVCGATLYYTVYLTGSRPGSPVFTAMNIPWKCNCSGATFGDGLGPCSGNDQKWSTVSNNINLTNRAPGNYTLEIYYQYTGGNTNSTCNITHYINNGGSATNYTATFTIVASGASCGILPIELLNFSGECLENEKIVTWSTASETNSSHFLLESSKDGLTWDSIQIIKAAGISTKNKTYSFIDTNRSNILNYYRLTEFDFDGQKRFNQIIPLNCKNRDDVFYSYPNPSDEKFAIYFQNNSNVGEYEIKILNLESKLIHFDKLNIEKGLNLICIENKLSEGIYFISISKQNQDTKILKHIVH